MNTQYAQAGADSPHIQIEIRKSYTGETGSIEGLGGGREWHAERRILVDGEPVTDWLDMAEHGTSDLAESADHDAITEDRISSTLSDARIALKEDQWDRDCEPASDRQLAYYTDSPPWSGSTGYGKTETGEWRIG
jgi:hypothetical protein